MVEYQGFTIKATTFDEVTVAKATLGKKILKSKRFSGSSGERRAIAHCKRQIESLAN